MIRSTLSAFLLSFLLVISSSSCLAQKNKPKTYVEFEKEYIDRVYTSTEDRMLMEPFKNATTIKIYTCSPIEYLPKDTIANSFSYDNLVNIWINKSTASILLTQQDIIALSDIIINSKKVEYAKQFAKEHYKDYLAFEKSNKTNEKYAAGYAFGHTRDYDGNIKMTIFQPDYLIVFYDNEKKTISYIGVDNHSIEYISKPYYFFGILQRNQLKQYIQNTLHLNKLERN